MNPRQFEAQMRAGEIWHGERVPADKWAIVRVDGRGFSRFTQQHFAKPFDVKFYDLMAQTARALMQEWDGIAAYFESDEISLLLPRGFTHFGRGWEKLVSLCAATASAHFSRASGEIALFDARLWVGSDVAGVADYFRWRQSDAARCALNGWCYWTLRAENQSARAATRALDGLTQQAKENLLRERGIIWNELPNWQRRGASWTWETYQTQGVDPVKGTVAATRRRLTLQENLPWGAEYGAWILDVLADASNFPSP